MLVLVSSFASASVNYFYDFEDDTTGELPSYMDDLDSAGICTVSETSPISGSKSLLCLAGTTVLDYAYYNFTGLKYFENGTNFTITSDFYSGPAANSDFTFTVMSRDGERSTGMSFRQTNGFGLRLYADDVLLYGNDALSMLSQTLSMVMRQADGHQYFEITGKDNTTQTDTSITISGDIILGMYDGQSRTSKHDNINITCWDCFPPVLSIDNTTLNMTSDGGCTAWRTNKSTACNTTDGTPTVTFDTNIAGNCSLRNTAGDYNSSFICSTTGSTSHVCTIYNAEKLVYGVQSLYASCSDGTISDTTGAMAINMTAGTQYSLDPCLEVLGVGCSATYTDGCYEIST